MNFSEAPKAIVYNNTGTKFPKRKKEAFHCHKYSVPISTNYFGDSTPKSYLINNEFYNEVESILREIDPKFKLFELGNSPMNRILNCLKEATNVIINSQSKEEADSFLSDMSIICENCGKSSTRLAKYEVKLNNAAASIRNKKKTLEKSKFIHLEKIKEEKTILSEMKYKLENLSEKLTEQNEIFNKDFRETKINSFTIENYCISINNQAHQILHHPKKIELENFNVFQGENNLDFTSFIEELENQMLKFNQEISLRENLLDEREEQLNLKENEVRKQLNEIEYMNMSLENSKNEILELNNDIFPSLEFQTEMQIQLIKELQLQKSEMDIFLKKIGENLKFKDEEEKIHEAILKLDEKQKRFDEFYKNKEKELKENADQLVKLQKNVDLTINTMAQKEKELFIISKALKEKEMSVNSYTSRS